MIKSLYKEYAERWSSHGSVYIISDTHFDDSDCKLMDPNWFSPQEHMEIIKKDVRKTDTLIHLGDVGDPTYLDELKCHKVLLTGNHDKLSVVEDHFDEIYTGPLFIADRLLLSHEPIVGIEQICYNIHGHDHEGTFRHNHINLASNVYHFRLFNLGASIKGGLLSQVENYHRKTIDRATDKKNKKILDMIDSEPIFVPFSNVDITFIPEACRTCSNHPLNGGSGNCNCTLGMPTITC